MFFVQLRIAGISSGLGNSVNYYLVNAGVSFAHGGDKVSYVIGAAANNINQPNDAIEKKQSSNNTLICAILLNWVSTQLPVSA
jgi:membrane protein YqaA with SNARE-associated domain